jgi:hypothetical protein
MVESEFPAIHGEYRNTAGEWLRIVPVVSRGGLMTLFGLVVLVVAALVAAGGEVVNAIVSAAFGLSLVTGWYCVPFVWWSMRGRRDVFEARQVLEATAEELRLTSDFGVFSYISGLRSDRAAERCRRCF